MLGNSVTFFSKRMSYEPAKSVKQSRGNIVLKLCVISITHLIGFLIGFHLHSIKHRSPNHGLRSHFVNEKIYF